MIQFVIIMGNPVDGIELIGPFDCGEDAIEYATQYRIEEYWVSVIQEPSR